MSTHFLQIGYHNINCVSTPTGRILLQSDREFCKRRRKILSLLRLLLDLFIHVSTVFLPLQRLSDISEEQLYFYAASTELWSEHPLGKAVVGLDDKLLIFPLLRVHTVLPRQHRRSPVPGKYTTWTEVSLPPHARLPDFWQRRPSS